MAVAGAGPEVVARYDTELDAAFVRAREDGDLTGAGGDGSAVVV
jgi:hypothetical protein